MTSVIIPITLTTIKPYPIRELRRVQSFSIKVFIDMRSGDQTNWRRGALLPRLDWDGFRLGHRGYLVQGFSVASISGVYLVSNSKVDTKQSLLHPASFRKNKYLSRRNIERNQGISWRRLYPRPLFSSYNLLDCCWHRKWQPNFNLVPTRYLSSWEGYGDWWER